VGLTPCEIYRHVCLSIERSISRFLSLPTHLRVVLSPSAYRHPDLKHVHIVRHSLRTQISNTCILCGIHFGPRSQTRAYCAAFTSDPGLKHVHIVRHSLREILLQHMSFL
jgi:hypothetical protein